MPEDDKIQLAYYHLTNPRSQIEAYVYDVVRSEVPKIELDDVFLEKEKISAAIASELKQVDRCARASVLAAVPPLPPWSSPQQARLVSRL